MDLDKRILHNPYQAQFHDARRLRQCLLCRNVGTPAIGTLQCPKCRTIHRDNTKFPRVFTSLHLRAGRRSGKSLAGAHAVREELSIPGQKWWVCGPTFKILHDATMPTLLRLIPPEWVKNWNQDNLELELKNDSVCQFRSLDDPERGRGQGLHGVWLDEAAFIAERAWQVLSPSLAENAGVVISTTSPGGYDWTYKEFYKRAILEHEPGYWAAKYRTLDNPLFQQSPVLQREVKKAKATMPVEVFSAEYEGDDVNFTGAIYGQHVESQILDDDGLRKLLPEWPNIDVTRSVVIGLDSGADHPFGAVLVVPTAAGLVVCGEYLERHQAMTTHLGAITACFGTNRFSNIKWAANKNEAQLRLEWGLRNVGVIPAESSHLIGIQRVQSWLLTKQLWFAASRVPRTIDQMRSYRYAENTMTDGQKRDKEQVFKKDDELPDAIRYAVMAWPELPKVAEQSMTAREQSRWSALDEQSKADIERIKAQDKKVEMKETDADYPIGEFYGGYAESLF